MKKVLRPKKPKNMEREVAMLMEKSVGASYGKI